MRLRQQHQQRILALGDIAVEELYIGTYWRLAVGAGHVGREHESHKTKHVLAIITVGDAHVVDLSRTQCVYDPRLVHRN